ncbi:MAG: DUF3641 domain-containing protein, partial [Nitrospinota bacterium]|nr:DUF3641 domain-containing protein [Nitrospinota bacterium]
MAKLNEAGYGREGSGLEMDIVSNPSGAFLPSNQEKLEWKFRADLERKHGLVFNSLYTFTNVPLGRFQNWLVASGNYENYFREIKESFNPCAIEGLMCRSLLSVGWDGRLYDCDFNQAAGLPLGGKETHITSLEGPPEKGSSIATGEHCFSCAAGSGFT